MDRNKLVELVDTLEREVNNGGFDQFFYNSAGDHTIDTIDALELIGAHETATILKRAAAKFPGGTPPNDRFTRQDLLLQISPEADAFRELDAEFYAYPDELDNLVKKHLAL